MIKKILGVCALAMAFIGSVNAQEGDERRAAVERSLISLTGTVAVLDHVNVQAALAESERFFGLLGRLDQSKLAHLIETTGFRVWERRPRMAVFLADDVSLAFINDQQFLHEADWRGLSVAQAVPDAVVMGQVAAVFQAQNRDNLPAVLARLEVDALVRVRLDANGHAQWQWLQPGVEFSASTPLNVSWQGILPHVIAEKSAASIQWPEAAGRYLIHVQGVHSLKTYAEVESALQRNPEFKGVSLVRLEGDHAYFAVDNPSLAQINSLLKQDGRFLEVTSVNYHDEHVRLAQQGHAMKSTWIWQSPKAAVVQ